MTRRTRILKWCLAQPVKLYDAGGGPLLGHRFLLLTHRGRRTGRLYRNVLEVVRWRSDVEEAVVVSGWGAKAGWYRNVLAGGAVEVRIARRRFAAQARPLDEDEAVETLAGYERRNRALAPVLRAALSRMAGFRYDGSLAARRRLVRELPLIAFRPVDRS